MPRRRGHRGVLLHPLHEAARGGGGERRTGPERAQGHTGEAGAGLRLRPSPRVPPVVRRPEAPVPRPRQRQAPPRSPTQRGVHSPHAGARPRRVPHQERLAAGARLADVQAPGRQRLHPAHGAVLRGHRIQRSDLHVRRPDHRAAGQEQVPRGEAGARG